VKSGATIFLGNSHTEIFDLSCFVDTLIVNRGISGDVTEGVLKRLPEIYRFNPKKIFIEIGVNDIFIKVPLNRIVSNYNKIIANIRKNCPDTKIFIQSIFPTDNKSVNKKILQFNSELKDICQKKFCTYINLYDLFEKEKTINPGLTTDGLHLNDKGYEIWGKTISGYVLN